MTTAGTRMLGRLHLRVYTAADYLQRWNQFFGWQSVSPDEEKTNVPSDDTPVLVAIWKSSRLSSRKFAKAIGADASLEQGPAREEVPRRSAEEGQGLGRRRSPRLRLPQQMSRCWKWPINTGGEAGA